METAFENIRCNLCGTDDYSVVYYPARTDIDPARIFSASGSVMGTQHIVRCNRCGLIYVQPRVKSEIVRSAYENSTDELYVSQAAARLNTFKSNIRLVENYAPSRGRILDVGAAAGFFMKAAQENGWEVYGVELSKWLADHGNSNFGFNIKACALKDAKFPNHYFDVVTMWDVLEHTLDPSGELQEISKILKPDGLLVINYPDIGTAMAKLAGRRWWFLLSGHLFYFDQKTIKIMLENAGFSVIKSKMHFQGMELGHLAKMLALYSKPLSSLVSRIFRIARLERVQLKYYASQINVIARKMV